MAGRPAQDEATWTESEPLPPGMIRPPVRGAQDEASEAKLLIELAARAEQAGDARKTLRLIAQAHTQLDLWRARLLSAQTPR